MNTFAPCLASVKPAARVLFDATTFRNASPGFAASLLAPTPAAVSVAPKPSPRNFNLEGFVWTPSEKGYDAFDQADLAAGRLITLAELLAREDVEEEAMLLANCPAEVHEESLYRFMA